MLSRQGIGEPQTDKGKKMKDSFNYMETGKLLRFADGK